MSPWQRLDANAAIGACHDDLSVSENLAVFVTSGSSIPMPVERSIYMWMYEDAGSHWGHRHAILWYPYNDNSGTSGMEGFLGIGRAYGGPYQGPFSQPWNFAELIVMNVFDPCEDWFYGVVSPEAITGSPDQMIDNIDGTVSVNFSGTINPNGTETEGYFEYWLVDFPPSQTILTTPIQNVGSGQSPLSVSATVTNLIPDTEYAFRIAADNGLEVVLGETIEFNTHLAYSDDNENDDHCNGFSPCSEPHIQEAVESSVSGGTVKVQNGNYLEDSSNCSYSNVYVYKDVILHLGLDDSYIEPAGEASIIRKGAPEDATLTIESGSVVVWRAVIY
jgi:hypothetical protein